jgi:cell division protein FtsN
MVARQGTKAKAGGAEVAPAAGRAQPVVEASSDLKRTLLWRMGLAGLMVLALLGVLALFDHANAPDDSLTGQQFTEPVPVRKNEPVQPLTAAETPLAAPVEEHAVSSAVSSEPAAPESASEVASAPGTESPAKKKYAGGTHTRPLSKAGDGAGDEPGARPATPPPPPPQVAATPALPPPARRPSENSASMATPPPLVETPPAVAVRLVSGFIVQSGLFSDLALAEEWQARLAQEGIPSMVEARLQIGPFKNRSEAEAARRQLKKLGIDAPSTVRRFGKP